MQPERHKLPIDDSLPAIRQALSKHSNCVLLAPTGAGKSTRVPLELATKLGSNNSRVLLLEPRRLAAKALAHHMAKLSNSPIGDFVGYQVRFDRKFGPKTKLLVVTEGILLRIFASNPFLENIDAIMFDEFHERSINSDLALALSRQLQQEIRPELKLLVMSATLQPDKLQDYLDDCPLVVSKGRSFPLEIEYLKQVDDNRIEDQILKHLPSFAQRCRGHILVFLPGLGEIKRTAALLSQEASLKGSKIMQLYGNLPLKEQESVIKDCPQQKIILCTNIAESSLTINGVTGVIDSGLARKMEFVPGMGMNRLRMLRISKASADQRAGRAGRTAPGIVLRLWSSKEHQQLDPQDQAEIQNLELSASVLQLYAQGETRLEEFNFFEAPPASHLERAISFLSRMACIENRTVTQLGKKLSLIPADIRLAKLAEECAILGIPAEGSYAASFLSQASPFHKSQRSRSSRPTASHSENDLIDQIRAFARGRAGELTSYGQISSTGQARVKREAQQILKSTDPEARLQRADQLFSRASETPFRLALLACFHDRLALRRNKDSRQALMVGKKGVELLPASGVQSELFLCIELHPSSMSKMGELQVSVACEVDLDEIRKAGLIEHKTEVEYSTELDKVRCLKRSYVHDLVVHQQPQKLKAEYFELVQKALYEAGSKNLVKSLKLENSECADFLQRVKWLAATLPEEELPEFNESDLLEVLSHSVNGIQSLAQIKTASVLQQLKASLNHEQLQLLNKEAPTHFSLPNGSSVAIQYSETDPPEIHVRIQEVLGLKSGPRLAKGRVNCLFHLLAPNYRAQQITADLENFWLNTYQQVRKDLRRRYSKHDWPENPMDYTHKKKRPRR